MEKTTDLPVEIPKKHGRPIYSANPSVPTSDGITKRRQKRIGNEQKGLIIDSGTGEIIGRGAAVVYEWEEVDQERFVKLFIGGLKKAAGLSKTGLALFETVYQQMRERPNTDQVMLSHLSASKSMKKSSYYAGVAELLDREILYRSQYDGIFFVDINCMFNGDRLAFVKGYHLKNSQPSLPLPEPEQPETVKPPAAPQIAEKNNYIPRFTGTDYEEIRAAVPRAVDIYADEIEWRDWCSKQNEIPQDPKHSFIEWLRRPHTS